MNQNTFDFWFDLSPKCTSKCQAEGRYPCGEVMVPVQKRHEIFFPFHYAKPVGAVSISLKCYISYLVIAILD